MRGFRNNQSISIAVGIVLAAIAGVMVFWIIQSQAPTIPVVVAVRNINVGEAVTEESIDVQNFPASMVPSNTLQSESQALGTKVSYGPVMKGSMLYQENISRNGTLKTLLLAYAPVVETGLEDLELEPGDWAALEISADNGIRGLQEGDFVDIYGERPVAADSVDVAVIVPHALIIAIPSEKYQKYTVAVEQKYLEAAAEITVRKMNVVMTLSSRQPMVTKSGIQDASVAVNVEASEDKDISGFLSGNPY